MTADELRELQDRGRFFYEMFPGAKAADEWKRDRDRVDEGDHAKNASKPATMNPVTKPAPS
jgi:hypothetical protein